jgi:hypothetical protein
MHNVGLYIASAEIFLSSSRLAKFRLVHNLHSLAGKDVRQISWLNNLSRLCLFSMTEQILPRRDATRQKSLEKARAKERRSADVQSQSETTIIQIDKAEKLKNAECDIDPRACRIARSLPYALHIQNSARLETSFPFDFSARPCAPPNTRLYYLRARISTSRREETVISR